MKKPKSLKKDKSSAEKSNRRNFQLKEALQRLEKTSIYEILERSRIERSESNNIHPTGETLFDIQFFLWNSTKYSENALVRYIFYVLLYQPYVREFESKIRPIIEKCPINDLLAICREEIRALLGRYRRRLNGTDPATLIQCELDFSTDHLIFQRQAFNRFHDREFCSPPQTRTMAAAAFNRFHDREFLTHLTIFIFISWELTKKLIIADSNPARYCASAPMGLSLFELWNKPDLRQKKNAIVQKALGVDIDHKLLEDIKRDAKRIDTMNSEQAYDFLIDNFYKLNSEKFSGLSELELRAKNFEQDEDFFYIPNAANRDLINENEKHKKEIHWEDTQKDLPESLRSIESLPDIPKLFEADKVSDLMKWIESITDPIDKKIAYLKLVEGITFKQIEKKLSIPKSTIHDRFKKLNPLL